MSPTIPDWFIEHCVKTAQELAEREILLTIRDNVSLGHESAHGIGEPKVDAYEVDTVVYEPLLNILSSQTAGGPHVGNPDPQITRFFQIMWCISVCRTGIGFPIIQAYAEWGFLEGTPTQKKFEKQELCGKEVVDLVCALHRDSDEEHIKDAILRIGRREKALDD